MPLKSAAYVIAIATLLIGIIAYRDYKFRTSLRKRKPSRSFRVCQSGGDPFQDRIEFHIREE